MIFMTLTFNNRLNSQSYNPDFLLDALPVKWHIFKKRGANKIAYFPWQWFLNTVNYERQ